MVCNFLACISFKDLTCKCEKKLASQHEQLIKDFNCENPQYCKKNLRVKGTDNSSPPELMYNIPKTFRFHHNLFDICR